MLGLLFGRPGARRLFAPRAGVSLQQRATYIHSKPPQEEVKAWESVFVLTVLFSATLGPSGWILSHLEEYKTRD